MLFYVVNLGCKVNKVESDAYATQLLRAGLKRASLEEADLVVVNTCAVTGEAEKKTRKTVRHVCRQNRHARIFVTGCSAALHADVYRSMSERVEVLGKAEAGAALDSYLATARQTVDLPEQALSSTFATSLESKENSLVAWGEGFRTRVGIKVQDGCNNACTYCIVHVARGKATSRPAEEVLKEVCAYARVDVKEFVLSGINLGSYHQTYQGKQLDLVGLLRLLLNETSGLCASEFFPRFRIGSVEPMDVSDELIGLMAASQGRICRHLHLPLQAGSSKVLSEMNRPYTAQEYLDLVAKLKKSMPRISLSTDIIVGFPGETDEDFTQTCQVARACDFSKVHVFPYSPREGTPAAARSDQVDALVKTQRAQQLRALAGEIAARDRESRCGTTEWAIVESNGTAMTESYYSVSCDQACEIGSAILHTF